MTLTIDMARPGSLDAPFDVTLITYLRAAWERVFARTPIGLHDNFFELGGDSLMAAILFAEIDRDLGRTLSLTAIYEHPTIAALAEALAGCGEDLRDGLVLLKPGEGDPLFIIHGIGGSALQLAAIARNIPAPNPVYGIEARGLAGDQPPRQSIAEMATGYIAAIRARQPCGPYRLAGYSFGGIVAQEMARRLQSEGDKIALLALIDSYVHPDRWPRGIRLTVLGQRLRNRLKLAGKQSVGETAHYLLWRARQAANRAKMQAAGQRPSRFGDVWGLPPALRRVREASETALLEYEQAFYDGRIDFIRATTNLWYPPDPRPLWQHLARSLDVVTVPGEHLELVDRQAPAVAAALAAMLRRPDGLVPN
jgi:acetoacetyl-CoA synthetase